ncbi:hypothetical protein CYMTET_25449 [Cymbomonas tetramitiformis]|uniref:RING-type domain-containing protein n=1 Tax=Cymbomonas tetramitiformis TaxID=36881 RepID=A0AAE0FUI2_9CHLO|nr:hypothetical protein CYMTET_25449 [Cymbomonas tetramitiformis]
MLQAFGRRRFPSSALPLPWLLQGLSDVTDMQAKRLIAAANPELPSWVQQCVTCFRERELAMHQDLLQETQERVQQERTASAAATLPASMSTLSTADTAWNSGLDPALPEVEQKLVAAEQLRERGNAAFRDGDKERAAAIYGEVLHDLRGWEEGLAGQRTPEAETVFRGIHRAMVLCYSNRAECHLCGGRWEDARADCEQGIAIAERDAGNILDSVKGKLQNRVARAAQGIMEQGHRAAGSSRHGSGGGSSEREVGGGRAARGSGGLPQQQQGTQSARRTSPQWSRSSESENERLAREVVAGVFSSSGSAGVSAHAVTSPEGVGVGGEPSRPGEDGDEEKEVAESCPICFECGNLKRTRCGHFMHIKCAARWSVACKRSKRQVTCPVCRSERFP